MPEPKEVEAKFLFRQPSAWRVLARLTRLGPFRLSQQRRERQVNLYWDTADLRLKRAHAALKLRRVGSKRELTFKREIAYRRGVSERVEVTSLLRPEQVLKFTAGRLKAEPVLRARKITGNRPWVKVLVLHTDRSKRIFSSMGREIELDLDRVSIRRGRQTLAIHRELEVENRSAPGPLFQQFLAELRRLLGRRLRPGRLSKYEVGLRLVKR